MRQTLLLAVACGLLLAATAVAQPPDLIVPSTDPTGVWHRIQSKIWTIFQTGKDYNCESYSTDCPCVNKYTQTSASEPLTCVVTTDVLCGSLTRKAWRACFHDAGTYNESDNVGGMNGSLQFELDRSENWSAQLFEIVDKYTSILETEVETLGRLPNGKVNGMADIIALGGLLAITACGHPGLPFAPDRVDALHADPPNMLPGNTISPSTMFAMFSRMSFDRAQMVTIIAGGHTMANLEGASLDGTPWTFDNVWQQNMLNGGGPFLLHTDENCVTDAASRVIVESQADSTTGTATFFDYFKSTAQKMLYLGQDLATRSSEVSADAEVPTMEPIE